MRKERGKSYSATIYDALAAAYAESGDFDAAKKWEAKAIDVAPNEKCKDYARSHLELYEQGKPYHQEAN